MQPLTTINDAEDVFQYIDEHYIAQITCLVAQTILTIFTIIQILRNSSTFPIKQLGPFCTIVAILSLLFGNVVSFSARILQDSNNYYNPNSQRIECGQCRLYEHSQMIVLFTLYSILRELPLILFIVKTLRVCLCYQSRIYMRQRISPFLTYLFKSQKAMIVFSLILALIMSGTNLLLLLLNIQKSYAPQFFEFFCPKQSGSSVDAVANFLRFFCLAIVYLLSIHAYKELDFKKFLILLFIVSDSQCVLRMVMIFMERDHTSYHQFYYHSFIIQLFGTIVLAYFSQSKDIVNPPPTPQVISDWTTFINLDLGIKILQQYASIRDKDEQTTKYTQTVNNYLLVADLIEVNANEKKTPTVSNSIIENILTLRQQLNIQQNARISLINRNELSDKGMKMTDLRQLHYILQTFCIKQLYEKWKKTKSYHCLHLECEANMYINNVLDLFEISID